ncbi:ATP synthase subunit s, mitochondrial-like [Liolophura sinensis]|uniref:ATP synthase subunit s, mitochondrial-like n=1 Tax=Liolophura sinensis TaxID=3198878 RepID=UPI0031590A8B
MSKYGPFFYATPKIILKKIYFVNFFFQIRRQLCLSQAIQSHCVLQKQFRAQNETSRNLWGWLNSVFNRVDKDRVKTVGPDRACAEWLLRCGASVRWAGFDHWEKDYNRLPAGNFDKYKISEIDASNSAVMGIGFPHLEGLKEVKKIVLHNCGYLDDSAIELLPLVKDSLRELQISSCGDVTQRSLPSIAELQKLQSLVMFDLPEIKDRKGALEMLSSALPKCKIAFYDLPEKESSGA